MSKDDEQAMFYSTSLLCRCLTISPGPTIAARCVLFSTAAGTIQNQEGSWPILTSASLHDEA